jgi:hypothetical protein
MELTTIYDEPASHPKKVKQNFQSIERQGAKKGRLTDSTYVVILVEEVYAWIGKDGHYLLATLLFEFDGTHSATRRGLTLASRAQHGARNDGGNSSAVLEDRVRNDAHHASRTTAIHERASIRRECATQGCRKGENEMGSNGAEEE